MMSRAYLYSRLRVQACKALEQRQGGAILLSLYWKPKKCQPPKSSLMFAYMRHKSNVANPKIAIPMNISLYFFMVQEDTLELRLIEDGQSKDKELLWNTYHQHQTRQIP